MPDTSNETGWESFTGHTHFRSWLGVPLVASEEFLGFFSVGHGEPNQFTGDHLRRAELLVIPAARPFKMPAFIRPRRSMARSSKSGSPTSKAPNVPSACRNKIAG